MHTGGSIWNGIGVGDTHHSRFKSRSISPPTLFLLGTGSIDTGMVIGKRKKVFYLQTYSKTLFCSPVVSAARVIIIIGAWWKPYSLKLTHTITHRCLHVILTNSWHWGDILFGRQTVGLFVCCDIHNIHYAVQTQSMFLCIEQRYFKQQKTGKNR